MAARSDHSRALPDGSASTSSTVLPDWAKMWASQTADVVLPVPGLRLSRATLRAGIYAVLQYLRHYVSGSAGPPAGKPLSTSTPGPPRGERGRGAESSTGCGSRHEAYRRRPKMK